MRVSNLLLRVVFCFVLGLYFSYPCAVAAAAASVSIGDAESAATVGKTETSGEAGATEGIDTARAADAVRSF